MELFEFLMILLSIIIGLGVTEVLGGAARLLRAREQVRFYWLHGLLQAGIFFSFLQSWWESWGLRTLPELTFLQAGTLLLGPVLSFLIAALLYPEQGARTDLRAYYFRQAPILWLLVAAGTAAGTFLKPLAMGWPVFQPGNLSGLLTIPLALLLVFSHRPRLHEATAIGIVVLLVADTVVPSYLISA